MWSAVSEQRHAYLGTRCIAFQQRDGSLQWRAVESVEEGVQLLADSLQPQGRASRIALSLWLSGALARPFVVEPVAGLRGWKEARQLAAGMAPDATGLAGPCTVWLDEGLPMQRVLAAAIEQPLQDTIAAQFSRRKRLHLTSIQPWWAYTLKSVCQREPDARLLVVQEPDAWTLLAGEKARFSLAATRCPVISAEQATGWTRRNALGAEGDVTGKAWSARLIANGQAQPDPSCALPLAMEVWR